MKFFVIFRFEFLNVLKLCVEIFQDSSKTPKITNEICLVE